MLNVSSWSSKLQSDLFPKISVIVVCVGGYIHAFLCVYGCLFGGILCSPITHGLRPLLFLFLLWTSLLEPMELSLLTVRDLEFLVVFFSKCLCKSTSPRGPILTPCSFFWLDETINRMWFFYFSLLDLLHTLPLVSIYS